MAVALNYVTLTVDVYDGQGNVVTGGTATFTPSVTLTDATNNELIAQIPITVTFRPSGSPVVKLLATDNGTLAPSGWGWTVTFAGTGLPSAFNFFLPYTGGASQNLADLSPVSTVVTQYPANPMTTAGDMVYENATPTPARLGIGSNGQVLAVVAGIPGWSGAVYAAPAASGGSDDSAALNTWLAALPTGVTVWFPAGTYKVNTATISLPNGNRYICSGSGQGSPGQTIFQRQSGATISGAVVADAAYLSASATPSAGKPIHIEGLTIDGNQAADSATTGHGLVTLAFRAKIIRCNVMNTPQAGIVIADQTFAGHNITNTAVENRVLENTVSSPGTQGIYVQDHGTKACTDGYMRDNIVNTPGVVDSTSEGIRIERAAGWFISGNHPYNNPANGFYLDGVYATSFIGNECDQFGKAGAASTTYYAFYFHTIIGQISGTQEGHPLVCMGNQAWADESFGSASTAYHYYAFRVAGASEVAYVNFMGNGAHQKYGVAAGGGSYPADYNSDSGTLVVNAAGNLYDGVFTAGWTQGGGGTLLIAHGATGRSWAKSGSVTPSATLNTFGAATTYTPNTGCTGIQFTGCYFQSGGTFGSETVTVQLELSYINGTNKFLTKTFAASGATQVPTVQDMTSVVQVDDGLLTSVAVSCKSTISSSAATVTATLSGFNVI